jgi:hypothetical protein
MTFMRLGLDFVSLWFGIIMVLVVVSGAIAFTFTDVMVERLYGSKRTVFIFILLAYGIYRGYRVYQLFKATKDND